VKKALIVSFSFLTLGTLGCQFYARNPEEYSAETSKLIDTKREELKSCYDEILEKDSAASGIVTVDFLVEAKTGVIKDVVVDKEKSTAPEALETCLVEVIEGLKLDPPDQREGKASWTYKFDANQPKD
jgi:hypothetical protein